MKIEDLAAKNFEQSLRQNPYPGRGIVIGRSGEDAWLILYWIMGRSANSRNRRFVVEGSVLRTEPVDMSLVTDPSLIIYEAMLDLPGLYLVSNGDQTRTMRDTIQARGTIENALATREREPDAPNYTPRISGMVDFRGTSPAATLSILKANPADPAYTDRFFYRVAMPKAGIGAGLTTYSGDGTPLPSFAGDPLILPLAPRAEETLETYWNALNADNRISLAVKEITRQGASSRVLVRNRF